MSLEDIFFREYTNVLLELFIILLWGWGALYAFGKSLKYRKILSGMFKMWLGSVGCFGMMLLRISDNFVNIPDIMLFSTVQFDQILVAKQQVLQFWGQIDKYYGKELIQLSFQACIIIALATKFITKELAAATVPATSKAEPRSKAEPISKAEPLSKAEPRSKVEPRRKLEPLKKPETAKPKELVEDTLVDAKIQNIQGSQELSAELANLRGVEDTMDTFVDANLDFDSPEEPTVSGEYSISENNDSEELRTPSAMQNISSQDSTEFNMYDDSGSYITESGEFAEESASELEMQKNDSTEFNIYEDIQKENSEELLTAEEPSEFGMYEDESQEFDISKYEEDEEVDGESAVFQSSQYEDDEESVPQFTQYDEESVASEHEESSVGKKESQEFDISQYDEEEKAVSKEFDISQYDDDDDEAEAEQQFEMYDDSAEFDISQYDDEEDEEPETEKTVTQQQPFKIPHSREESLKSKKSQEDKDDFTISESKENIRAKRFQLEDDDEPTVDISAEDIQKSVKENKGRRSLLKNIVPPTEE